MRCEDETVILFTVTVNGILPFGCFPLPYGCSDHCFSVNLLSRWCWEMITKSGTRLSEFSGAKNWELPSTATNDGVYAQLSTSKNKVVSCEKWIYEVWNKRPATTDSVVPAAQLNTDIKPIWCLCVFVCLHRELSSTADSDQFTRGKRTN